LVCAVASSAAAQRVHSLPATPATVAYGYYWSQAKPVLTIASGDMVDVETMLTNTPAGLERMGVKPEDVPQRLRDIVTQVTGDARGPGGHILTGPIYVTGADSGDVLEVRIQSISLPIAYGYNGCSGFIRELCEERGSRLILLDRKKMTAEVAPGITVPLRPFFGSIGVAPAPALGRVSSNPPAQHAGNMDNKELVAGTTLFIPVWVKGALLELGDGHAAQGDGEVDQTAIETNLTGRIQVIVRKDLKLDWPRIETTTHWITMGADTSLVVATKTAVRQMVLFLQHTMGITQTQAYQAASMAADLHITQLVDGNVGVHMMIAKSYLTVPPKPREMTGFEAWGSFGERRRVIRAEPGITATLIAPATIDPTRPVDLILYALPNGNTTEQTMGRTLAEGMDWHFDIQHIAAQTRVLREHGYPQSIVAYLEVDGRSWPSWRSSHGYPAANARIVQLVDELREAIGSPPRLSVTLTGHSGGGSFAFGFLDGQESLPPWLDRIAFLDSNYGFEAKHADKLVAWLRASTRHQLVALAYDDREIMLDGKKVVSDSGGTWRATDRMLRALGPSLRFAHDTLGAFVRESAPQVTLLRHPNPANRILHTEMIGEMNGFIHAMLVGRPGYGDAESVLRPERAYTRYVEPLARP